MITTDPWVIGTAQLKAHREYPCRPLLSPILVLARLTLSGGARGRTPKDGGILPSWRETARASPDPEVNGESLADFAGIVTCPLLRFKCPGNPPDDKASNMSTTAATPDDDPALLQI